MKKQYLIEITDTFGGDANYSWVKRFKVKASSVQGAISKLTKSQGYSGFKVEYKTSEEARYNLTGACVCAFVYEHDDTYATYHDLVDLD